MRFLSGYNFICRNLAQQNPKFMECEKLELLESKTELEWWEQFGDCYDYWPGLPDSEFDYLYWGLVSVESGREECEGQ